MRAEAAPAPGLAQQAARTGFNNGRARRARTAAVEAVRTEDGLRLATVRCPACNRLHEHVVPLDLAPDAPLVRTAKCRASVGDYALLDPAGLLNIRTTQLTLRRTP
jgi:hypothetical protein